MISEKFLAMVYGGDIPYASIRRTTIESEIPGVAVTSRDYSGSLVVHAIGDNLQVFDDEEDAKKFVRDRLSKHLVEVNSKYERKIREHA